MPATAPRARAIPVPPDLATREAGQALLRTFFSIADTWKLAPREAMTLSASLRVPPSTYGKRQVRGVAARHARAHLLRPRIYKALQMLLPSDEAADAWIRKPNDAPLFGGRSALDRLLSGNVADLYEVRRYVDAQRG
jgi:hypothetical protein